DPTPLARELDRALVGFRAAVAEEDALKSRVRGQQFGQTERRLVVEGRARCDQRSRLGGERLAHDLRTVAETVHGPALHEVEIRLAVVIGEPGAPAAHEDVRGTIGDVHQRPERELGDRRGAHSATLYGCSWRTSTRRSGWRPSANP